MPVVATVYSAKAIRTFGFGYASVVLALLLSGHGFSAGQIGALFSAGLLEDALLTATLSMFAHKMGARNILVASSFLIALAGAGLGLGTEQLIVGCAVVLGVISPAGFEGGPFTALEQAVLAKASPSKELAHVFSWYNLAGFFAAAAGALFASLWLDAARRNGLETMAAYRYLFLLYGAGGLVLSFIYCALNDSAGGGAPEGALDGEPKRASGLHKSKAHVLQLAGLQSLDSLGGGFIVQALLVYWFHIRYHVQAETLGVLFFGTNVLAAVSFLLAPHVARRVGLLNTMVFTHLPSNITLMTIPLMPNFESAAAMLLARSLLSSMDIPTRQAYTMLLVAPDERAAAAGLTTSARSVAQSLAPVLSGLSMTTAASGLPFYLAGMLKSIYDLALYFRFRAVPLEHDHPVQEGGKKDG